MMSRTAILGSAGLLLVIILGCTPAGPPRFGLQGKVTFKGEPVPAGSVSFTPKGANEKPPATGPIQKGQYKVPASEGVGSGKYTVRIFAYDGQKRPGKEGDLTPLGIPLPPFESEVDIPEGGKKDLDFDITPKK